MVSGVCSEERNGKQDLGQHRAELGMRAYGGRDVRFIRCFVPITATGDSTAISSAIARAAAALRAPASLFSQSSEREG